jgi:hypothetical protein
MWGGFRPYGAKSIRAKDTPNVLRPGILSTFTRVTFDPSTSDVFLGMFSPERKKSLAVTSFGSLQSFPFVKTAERKNFNNKKWTFFLIINGLITCDAEMEKGHQNVVVKTIEITITIEVSTSRRGIISCNTKVLQRRRVIGRGN